MRKNRSCQRLESIPRPFTCRDKYFPLRQLCNVNILFWMCKARKVSTHTLAWNHAILEVSFFAQVAKVTRSFYKYFSSSTRSANSVNRIAIALNNRSWVIASVCCLHLNSVFKKRKNWLKNINISFPGSQNRGKTRRSTQESPFARRAWP